MRAGIHYEPGRKFSLRLQVFEKILGFNGIESVRVCSSDINFWDEIAQCDFFIYPWGQWDAVRQRATAVIPVIENELKISCFPDIETCWSFDDKIRQYYLMKAHGFPMTKSWIFWEKEAALKWGADAALPIVFKLKGGAGSKNVIKIDSRDQLNKIINRMFKKGIRDGMVPGHGSLAPNLYRRLKRYLALKKRRALEQPIPHFLTVPNWNIHKNYVLFQEFLPSNQYDTRVTTIGDRAFAFQRKTRPGDFRSSGSGLIESDPQEIDLKMVKLALEISKKMNFQVMAYDFLYNTDKQIEFVEISYAFVHRVIYKETSGYWDSKLKWHEGKYWPQYFELMDFLGKPDLLQPDNIARELL